MSHLLTLPLRRRSPAYKKRSALPGSRWRGRAIGGAAAERIVLWTLVGLYAFVLFQTAWLNDDCFITFRVVDNFVNGNGLRWNVTNRVQAFTNPLWMLLISGFYYLTREIFFTSLFVSIVVSLTAVVGYAAYVAGSVRLAILGVLVLILSRSFVEYSTSGLENPLTHLLLVLFFWKWNSYRGESRQFLSLSFIAALIVLNRNDTLLLIIVPLLYAYFQVPKIKGLLAGLLGALPFVAWKVFSLIYYGFLLPNTAYAKLLQAGIGYQERFITGIRYYYNQIIYDPLSLVVITIALAVPLITKQRKAALLSGALLLHLLYIIYIGGCFMLGRFFAAPLLVAVMALTMTRRRLGNSAVLCAAALSVALGLLSAHPPLLSGHRFGQEPKMRFRYSISDERHFYYQGNGLLPNLLTPGPSPRHYYRERGLKIAGWPGVHTVAATGMSGFLAGPLIHLVDIYGLADPLLARLPAFRRAIPSWIRSGVGHRVRILPVGYIRSLREEKDRFQDRRLAAFYKKLLLITRGPLFTAERWNVILRMNTGRYDHLIDRDFYARRYITRLPLAELQGTVISGRWAIDAVSISPRAGLRISLGIVANTRWLDVSLDYNDKYVFVFRKRGENVERMEIRPPRDPEKGLVRFPIVVPSEAYHKGYDEIQLAVVGGDGKSSVGHLRLYPDYRNEVNLSELSQPFSNGANWSAKGTIEILPHAPLRVLMGKIYRASKIDVSLDHDDRYFFEFYNNKKKLGKVSVKPLSHAHGGLSRFTLQVPPSVTRAGYDEIRIRLVEGDPFCSIGHLIPIDSL